MDLETDQPAPPSSADSPWQVGYDHAKFGLRRDKAAPAEFLAGYHAWSGRTKRPGVFARKWLYLRLSALKRNRVLAANVTPTVLKEIWTKECPVTLEPMEASSGGVQSWSIDRLENSGGYALGNIVAMSQRANLAKADRSFEEVAAIAQEGKDQGNLTAIEWARLASLMYSAWNLAGAKGDPYVLPLATGLRRHMVHTTSQVAQHFLLEYARNPTNDGLGGILSEVTKFGYGRPEPLGDMVATLRDSLHLADYPYDVWLYPDCFDQFLEWLETCEPGLNKLLRTMWAKTVQGTDANSTLLPQWHVESKGYKT